MEPSKQIDQYVTRHYGNLISAAGPTFDEKSKTWVAELKSDYPRIITDDKSPQERILKFLPVRQIGEVRLSPGGQVEGTPRDECVTRLGTL